MTGDPRFSTAFIAEVKGRTSLAAVIGQRVRLTRRGREMLGLCPFHNDKTPSFTVAPTAGFYHCFGCGAHGDAVDFLMMMDGTTFPETVEQLAREAGMIDGADAPRRPLAPIVARETLEQRQARELESIEAARELWATSAPAAGTLVELYLESRAIVRPVPPTVRFHPRLKYSFDRSDTGARPDPVFAPAMVLAIQDVAGRVVGVHRTYLRADGRGKADVPKPKKMLGACWGGACRLTRVGEHLTIGEGLETTASTLEVDPDRAAWAALSLGNLAGAGNVTDEREPHPTKAGVWLPSVEPDMDRPGILLPPVVKRLTLLRDTKGDRATTDRLLQRAAARFARLGLEVLIATPPEGAGDFNDALMGDAA